jgi:ABC-type multidrug transport system fused ATPase/permease subunit
MSGLKIEPMEQSDRLVNYWKKEKAVVASIVIFGLSFNIGMILGPIYQGKLIDSIVAGEPLTRTAILAGAFVGLIALIQVLRYFKRFYIRRFANGTSATMRLMIYNNIMNKPTAELEKESAGNLMTRVVADVDLCVEGMRKFTTELFDTGVLMASYLVSLLVYDVPITLLSVAFIPVAMFLAEKLKTVIYKYTVEWRKKSSEVASLTYETIDNAMLYRIRGLERDNIERYEKELDDLRIKAVKANVLENSMQPIYNVIAMAGVLFVIGLGGKKVIEGGWTVGNFSTYITIFIAMAFKASKASKLFNSVQKSQISWKRIKPYLGEYRKKAEPKNTRPEKETTLEVDGLSFGFDSARAPIVSNIHFSAKGGEIIGITGPIASGKSSLALALTGLYPYAGSVRVNGEELRDIDESRRNGLISYMGHRPELLSDTIHDNIALGANHDTGAVLRDVCFDEDLSTMNEGTETLVGNGGVRLSGGQQARIALARALAQKKDIIILDDPFSAVDMATEEQIIENLRNDYRNSVVVIVSHRLSIFDKIDGIILLDRNGVADYGTHDELMCRSPVYAEIRELQCAECGAKK